MDAGPGPGLGLGATEAESIHADGRPEDRRLDAGPEEIREVDARPAPVDETVVAVQPIDDVERAGDELPRCEKEGGRDGETDDEPRDANDHWARRVLRNRERGVGGRGAGRGTPPVAFGSVAWYGATSFERRVRATGGARGGPAPAPRM